MPKVRQDYQSVYIFQGGYCFRPIFPKEYSHVYEDKTSFNEGMSVKGTHKGGSFITLTSPDGTKEVWYSHGAYMGYADGKKRPSTLLFKPDYEIWA